MKRVCALSFMNRSRSCFHRPSSRSALVKFRSTVRVQVAPTVCRHDRSCSALMVARTILKNEKTSNAQKKAPVQSKIPFVRLLNGICSPTACCACTSTSLSQNETLRATTLLTTPFPICLGWTSSANTQTECFLRTCSGPRKKRFRCHPQQSLFDEDTVGLECESHRSTKKKEWVMGKEWVAGRLPNSIDTKTIHVRRLLV